MKTIKFVNGPSDEQWAKTKTLPPHIEVSTLGRVRIYVTATEVEEAVPVISNNYCYICYGGNQYAVHRLVADTFIPYPEGSDDSKVMVFHSDGDKTNNRVDNLQWGLSFKSKNRALDHKDKIYCPELNRVYGTMRSAAYLTHIPQDIISAAIRDRKRVCGLTFEYISYSDPLVNELGLMYTDYDEMFTLASECSSVEELYNRIDSSMDSYLITL